MHPHRGIRIDSIPAQGVGGLVFALGIMALVWLGVPVLRPLLVGCFVGGVLFAPIFHKLGH
jgi:hypothetical protein